MIHILALAAAAAAFALPAVPVVLTRRENRTHAAAWRPNIRRRTDLRGGAR